MEREFYFFPFSFVIQQNLSLEKGKQTKQMICLMSLFFLLFFCLIRLALLTNIWYGQVFLCGVCSQCTIIELQVEKGHSHIKRTSFNTRSRTPGVVIFPVTGEFATFTKITLSLLNTFFFFVFTFQDINNEILLSYMS